jgi:hypothetical protein
MKKFVFLSFFFFSLLNYCISQSVGIGTDSPDSSAILDVLSKNKGFLPPRLALIATNIADPVINPKPGLLVYNTATSGGTPINVSPGYYYWNGLAWYPLVNKGIIAGDMQYWNGTRWIMIPLGLNGQVLTICNGIPIWGSCSNTITIKPANNQEVGQLTSNFPNSAGGAGGSQFTMAAWTSGGEPLNIRSIIKFDYVSIPAGAIIDSAKLYIYGVSNPAGGNGVDAHYGSSNSCYVRRITSSWTAPNPFTWNNPPSFSTQNESAIPQSVGSFDDNVINVTGMVKDMIQNGNYGFYFGLNTEVTYNVRQYASSFNSDASKHPKLVISYH